MRNIFIYTDGSCRPNPGYGGYGIHIAIGDTNIKPTNIYDKFKLTDRGYVNKSNLKTFPAKELYGLVEVTEIYGYKKESNTNNRAELDALIEAYKYLPKLKLKYEDIESVTLLSDSNYVLGWLEKILNNNHKIDTDTPNSDRLEELEALIKICLFDTKIIKVPAHVGEFGNERADLLALMGHNLNLKHNEPSMQKVYTYDKEFAKPIEPDMDIFYSKKLFYFHENTEKTYKMFNYKEESDIGKKLNDVQYALVKLKEPDATIKMLTDTFIKELDIEKVPIVIHLDKLTNKQLFTDLIRYKEDFIKTDLENERREPFLTLITITGEEIMRQLYPQVLSAKVETIFDNLEELFTKFINRDKTIGILDITDRLYVKTIKGKGSKAKEVVTFNPEIKNDKYKLKIELETGNEIFVYPKYDLPPRNTLKRLEKYDPRVYLIYKDLPSFYEYYCLVETDRSVILTTNYYANKAIKKKSKNQST